MNIEIYKAAFEYRDKVKAVIYWESNVGYGRLQINYTDNGKYVIDAEYMGLETVVKIIQKASLNPYEFNKGKVKPVGHKDDCTCDDCKLVNKIFN